MDFLYSLIVFLHFFFFTIKINFYKNIYVTPSACVRLIGAMKLDHGSNLLIVSTNMHAFSHSGSTRIYLYPCA